MTCLFVLFSLNRRVIVVKWTLTLQNCIKLMCSVIQVDLDYPLVLNSIILNPQDNDLMFLYAGDHRPCNLIFSYCGRMQMRISPNSCFCPARLSLFLSQAHLAPRPNFSLALHYQFI